MTNRRATLLLLAIGVAIAALMFFVPRCSGQKRSPYHDDGGIAR